MKSNNTTLKINIYDECPLHKKLIKTKIDGENVSVIDILVNVCIDEQYIYLLE